jgi:hypothetical protein
MVLRDPPVSPPAGESAREVDAAAWRAEPKAHGRRLHVPAERLLQDWKEVHDRTLAYLAALRIPAAEREGLAVEAVERALTAERWEPEGTALSETLDALRRLLCERHPSAAASAARLPDPFLAWRVEGIVTDRFAEPQGHASIAAGADGLTGSMPELARDCVRYRETPSRDVPPRVHRYCRHILRERLSMGSMC